MSRCLMSEKTGADLRAWVTKWGFTHERAADWLGISVMALRRTIYAPERTLTMQTAKLMKLFDRHIAGIAE